MKEGYIEQKCVRFAKEHGWRHLKVGRGGVPDALFFRGKSYAFVEFKTDAGVISDLQAAMLASLRKEGVVAMVIRPSNIEDFKEFFSNEKN